MIAVVNISGEDVPNIGINKYEVRINQKVICEFEHYRDVNGLADCLRCAANAVEKKSAEATELLLEQITNKFGFDT